MKNKEFRCGQAFQKGQADRLAYPLKSGRYKLEEVQRGLKENLQTLNEISAAKFAELNNQPRSSRPKVPEGAAGLIKKLPERIARQLGYYIIPAIEALGGDDLPAARVTVLSKHARTVAADIVKRCDAVQVELSYGVEVEYAHMKYDNSLLEPLLQDTIWLVDEVLREVDNFCVVS